MNVDYSVVQNTVPSAPLEVALFDATGMEVDTSIAQRIEFRMCLPHATNAALVGAAFSVTYTGTDNATHHKTRYVWGATDLQIEAGVYDSVVEVFWQNGTRDTFPTTPLRILVVPIVPAG